MTRNEMVNAIRLYREVHVGDYYRVTERDGVYLALSPDGVVVHQGTAKEVFAWLEVHTRRERHERRWA